MGGLQFHCRLILSPESDYRRAFFLSDAYETISEVETGALTDRYEFTPVGLANRCRLQCDGAVPDSLVDKINVSLEGISFQSLFLSLAIQIIYHRQPLAT